MFTIAEGIQVLVRAVHLRVQGEADVANLGDLLLYTLDDLEDLTAAKGGIRQLLGEKWRKVYKANAARGSRHRRDRERKRVHRYPWRLPAI